MMDCLCRKQKLVDLFIPCGSGLATADQDLGDNTKAGVGPVVQNYQCCQLRRAIFSQVL